jgi:predicted component of type VI protein secretion system
MSGRIDFTLDFKTRAAKLKRNPGNQYRIYILGCFSGRSDNPETPCKIHKIDQDSFNRVMAEIAPLIDIDGGISLNFASLDDFHPDVWLHKVAFINELLILRGQLQNPVTATQAASKIQTFLSAESSVKVADSENVAESQDDMLQRLLGKQPDPQASATNSLEEFIKTMVAPHISQNIQPQNQQLIAIIDSTVNQFARNILHKHAFQSLEALWRGTDALLNEEAAERHSFYLLDIGQDELSTEIKIDSKAFTQTLLQHIQKFDVEQDVLLMGDFSFSGNSDDNELMAYCANLAEACNAQFLAAVDQAFLQKMPDVHVNQKTATISSLMLAYPRYLLRLPYGNKRDPIDTIAFEECSPQPKLQELLWGNAAFVAARVLLRMAEDDASNDAQFFSDTPAFSFAKDGESILQPGTEVVLTETQANELLERGIMPLIGYQQQRGIRLLGVTTFLDSL